MSGTALNIPESTGRESGPAGRDGLLRQVIRGVCDSWFPENEGNAWNVEAIAHRGDRAFVRVRPDPDDVGYDRFVVLFDFGLAPAGDEAHAMYAEEGSSFGLLSTAPGCPADIPSEVIW